MHARRPTAALRPTPDNPGLWIAAVPSPRATYACACGHEEHAAGHRDVQRLVARYQDHSARCPRTAPPAQPTENGAQSGSHLRAIQGKINTAGVDRAA
ncbi:hypothetical protein ACFXPJ_04410 [Streptomyces goshikiensis]